MPEGRWLPRRHSEQTGEDAAEMQCAFWNAPTQPLLSRCTISRVTLGEENANLSRFWLLRGWKRPQPLWRLRFPAGDCLGTCSFTIEYSPERLNRTSGRCTGSPIKLTCVTLQNCLTSGVHPTPGCLRVSPLESWWRGGIPYLSGSSDSAAARERQNWVAHGRARGSNWRRALALFWHKAPCSVLPVAKPCCIIIMGRLS